VALESALAELNRLERALAALAQRDRRGRGLITLSARNGELPDRVAGMAEMRIAVEHAAALTPRLAATELDAADLREEFLVKRVERRQAETLIQETEAREAVEAARRGQQGLDDWYGNRVHGSEANRAGERS
jgi:prophage DNA circulation protein